MADWKMEAEIEYCVPCGYGNLAAYMVSELFQAGGPAIAISLKPGAGGVFKVTVDGRVLWDKKEKGASPHIMQVKELKAQVANMLKSGAVIQTN
jgi:selenoprotein W-related protein